MSEVNLPEVWCLPSFDNVVLNVNGARRPVSLKVREGIKGEYPYYGATGQIDTLNDFTHEGEHILIGEDGANLLSKSKDLAFIVDGQFWVNNHAHAVKCIAEMPAKFVASYINSLDLSPWVSGSAQPKLTKANLARIPMPLPPLAEQKVIADKLDTLLAQVETTKARLDRIPQILKTFRQSVLAAAVSGKLTEEWRGKNGVSEWQQKTLGDVVAGISQGWSPKCLSEETSGKSWGVIKTSSVQERLFLEQENKKLPEHLEPREALKVATGDILTTRAGPRSRCGVSCYVENVTLNLMICDKVYRYQVKPEMGLSKFLVMQLNSHPTLESIESLKTGISESGMNLTQKKFKELLLEWPSTEEQTQIVHRVEELFAFSDRIEQKANAALERVNNLTQSILAKAFRGEFTADWRAQNPDLISGENSAEALLAKIKAEREALSGKKKPKKKAAARKKA
mgnify:CR=1 FL=1